MKLQKRQLLALAAGLSLWGGAALAQQKEVTFAHQDMLVPFQAVIESGELEKATGYKINWRMFGGGGDVIKAMASGDVQLGQVGSSPLTAAVTQGQDIKLFWILDDIADAEALIARNGSNVNSVKDLKGLKFRIGGFGGKVMERLGVVPQNIPGGDIYPALEKGTIDSAEWVGPYDDLKLGFSKVAPFYYYPGFWEGGPQLDFFINDKAFAALTPEYKAIVEAAAAQAHSDMQAKYDARNPNALKQLVGSGTKLREFPKDVMAAAFKEAMAFYDEISAKNENWKKVYADYAKFRGEQNLWFRFTEAKFDSFMQSQKL